MERAVVNLETGQVIGNIRQGDRIVRKESIDRLKKTTMSSDIRSRHFVRVDEEEGKLLAQELSAYERAVLFQLQYYVSYESGLIRHANGREIGFADIVDMTGLSRKTVADAVEGLVKKDILYKGKNSKKTQYFLNPWIANKGVIGNPTLKDMFGNYRIRSKGNVRWKDL